MDSTQPAIKASVQGISNESVLNSFKRTPSQADNNDWNPAQGVALAQDSLRLANNPKMVIGQQSTPPKHPAHKSSLRRHTDATHALPKAISFAIDGSSADAEVPPTAGENPKMRIHSSQAETQSSSPHHPSRGSSRMPGHHGKGSQLSAPLPHDHNKADRRSSVHPQRIPATRPDLHRDTRQVPPLLGEEDSDHYDLAVGPSGVSVGGLTTPTSSTAGSDSAVSRLGGRSVLMSVQGTEAHMHHSSSGMGALGAYEDVPDIRNLGKKAQKSGEPIGEGVMGSTRDFVHDSNRVNDALSDRVGLVWTQLTDETESMRHPRAGSQAADTGGADAGPVSEAFGWGSTASVAASEPDAMYVELASEQSFVLSSHPGASESGVAPQRQSIMQVMLGGRLPDTAQPKLGKPESRRGWMSGILAEPETMAVGASRLNRPKPVSEVSPTLSVAMLPDVAAEISSALQPRRPSSVGVVWHVHSSENGQPVPAVPPPVAARTAVWSGFSGFFRSTIKAAISFVAPSFAKGATSSVVAPAPPEPPLVPEPSKAPLGVIPILEPDKAAPPTVEPEVSESSPISYHPPVLDRTDSAVSKHSTVSSAKEPTEGNHKDLQHHVAWKLSPTELGSSTSLDKKTSIFHRRALQILGHPSLQLLKMQWIEHCRT